MRYRVAFRQRFSGDGKEADKPESFIDVADGVILDSEFVERFEPDNLHVEEAMDEDDDFLPFGTEIWEFDIAPGREKEFQEAIERGGKAMEMDRVEEVEDIPAIEGQ